MALRPEADLRFVFGVVLALRFAVTLAREAVVAALLLVDREDLVDFRLAFVDGAVAWRPMSSDLYPPFSLPSVLLITKYPEARVKPDSRNFFWMLVITFSGKTSTSSDSPGCRF